MNNNSNKITTEFEKSKFLLNEFAESIHQLIKSLLHNSEVNPHQIAFRVKDISSLTKKMIRKNNKYNNLNEITDLVGIRIITFFEDDIDIIAELIEKEFDIDKDNSIDKRTLDTDKFGYRSLHYVASCSKSRLKLTEYKRFKNLKFELQIRSILQHSWAEIEHDIGYKGENEIPKSAKRTFYRVAALLEQADIEFVKLKQEIRSFEKQIKLDIESERPNIEINKSSLIAFIKESKLLFKLEKIAETKLCERGNSSSTIDISQNLIESLSKKGVNSLQEIEILLEKYGKEAIKAEENRFIKQDFKPNSFIPGAIIFWVLNYIEENNVA